VPAVGQPTSRIFEVPQFGHSRLGDGRMADTWILADALGGVQQLGNVPAGPAAMARSAPATPLASGGNGSVE
jgi:hypothetical protein